MKIKPDINAGVECLKSFRLYYGEKRIQLNEAVDVAGSELRLSQAWCQFEVDENDVVHRRLLGVNPRQPHVDADNMPTLEEQVCGDDKGTNYAVTLSGGGFSLLGWYEYSMYADSPHLDGLAYRRQVNDFKVNDFIRSSELKPGDEFITDTKLVIGFIVPRNRPGAVQVKHNGKIAWLMAADVPVCFMAGSLLKCTENDGATPGELAVSAIQQLLLKKQTELQLSGPLKLAVAIVGPATEPPIVRETKVFTAEYFEFLVSIDSRRELWRATEPDLDAVEDLHHGEVPVTAVNF